MSKTLIKFFFVMLFFALTTPFDLLAQESGFPIDPERNTEEEFPVENETVREGGMIIMDKENTKSLGKTNTSTESSTKKETIKASNKKEEPKPAAGTVKQDEDESVLSFNFLYYLIQKFKFNAVE